MASRKRSRRSRRGITPRADVSGTLGTLLRTTLHQVGVVKDAAVRSASRSRERLDEAMLERKRRDTLAALGEVVYELIVEGDAADLEEVDEIRSLVSDLEHLDARLDQHEQHQAPAPQDDGTVSSAAWSSVRRFHQAEGAAERVWRPTADVPDAPKRDAAPPGESAGPRRRRSAASGERRGGISFVDDPADAAEAELADYMHPDDVPEQ